MAPFDAASLLTSDGPWAYLLECSEGEVNAVAQAIGDELGIVVHVIRGEKCRTKEALLHEWATALRFPPYFGDNWDAFFECLTDLDWLAERQYVLLVMHTEQVLAEEGWEFSTFIGILGQTAAEWGTSRDSDRAGLPIAFRVIFQCEPGQQANVYQRLDHVGAHACIIESFSTF